MRFQSHGGGQQSVAMYLHLRMIGDLPDVILASDTGHEYPETYAVWEHQAKLCQEDGVPFHILKSEDGRDIIQKYTEDERLPLPHRRFPSCSTWSKKDRIRRWVRNQGVTEAVCLLGISTEEAGRAKDSDVQWCRNEFPLMDAELSRKDCQKLIRDHWTGPEVVKSGCKWCPWMGPNGLAKLYHEDRQTFDRVQAMEEGAKSDSGTLFRGMTVAMIAERAREGRAPPKEKDRPTPGMDQVTLMACDNGSGCWS